MWSRLAFRRALRPSHLQSYQPPWRTLPPRSALLASLTLTSTHSIVTAIHQQPRTIDHGYEPCRHCFPYTRAPHAFGSPTLEAPPSCASITHAEEGRKWITAHNARKCCGHKHRTLVLCFDGTGESFDHDSSNVVRFCSLLKKGDTARQVVYYQTGVGTFLDPIGSHYEWLPSLSLALDQAFAWNLTNHIKDGYTFLMQNYTEGDKICLFGFSRGAYTARALAGMLQKVGLLPADNQRQISAAYQLASRVGEEDIALCYDFKRKFSRTVGVEFMGLWDTVASVGVIPHHIPFVHENTGIRTLRHALALDERRVKFIPQFCHAPPKQNDAEEKEKMGNAYSDLVPGAGKGTDMREVWFAGVHTDVGGGAIKDNRFTTPTLARIPLRWMVRECFEANTGIVFDACMLQAMGLPVCKKPVPTSSGQVHYVYELPPPYEWKPVSMAPNPKLISNNHVLPTLVRALKQEKTRLLQMLRNKIATRWWSSPWTASPKPAYVGREDFPWSDTPPDECAEELKDIDTMDHCQLDRRIPWMLLELIPLRVEARTTVAQKMKSKSGQAYRWIWNRGKGRRIFQDGELLVHRSVKLRLERNPSYSPHARPEVHWLHHERSDGEYVARRSSRAVWNQDAPETWKWVPSTKHAEVEQTGVRSE